MPLAWILVTLFSFSATLRLPIIYRGAAPASKPAIDLGVVTIDVGTTQDSQSLLAALDAAQAQLGADAFVAESGDVRERYFCDECPSPVRTTVDMLAIFLPRPLTIDNPRTGIAGNSGRRASAFERNTYFRALRFIETKADRAAVAALQKQYTALTLAFLSGKLERTDYDVQRAALAAK